MAGGRVLYIYLGDTRFFPILPHQQLQSFHEISITQARSRLATVRVLSTILVRKSLPLIHRTTEAADATGILSGLDDISEYVDQNGAMLILKDSNWLQECPRFGLSVLIDHNFDDEVQLGSFLRHAIRPTVELPKMFLPGKNAHGQPLNRRDRDTLVRWRNSSQGGM